MMIYRILTVLFVFIGFGTILAAPAHAQTIIRDTEIEADMKEWLEPVFKAAGMSQDQVNIIMVQDDQLNAFVAGGANIFIYTGLLQKTDNPGEVIGVIAHELGHITGGHLIRGRERMEQASYESILGVVLGAGAAIATGDGGALAAISSGANSMAQRRFLSYARSFESSADQAALQYINTAQINPTGLKTFMQKLEGQELRPTSQQSEYVRSHPLTRDRVSSIEARVQESPYKNASYPAKWVAQHNMMRAKLTGFITPEQVAWVYDDNDKSIEAMAARTIAAYRMNDIKTALKLVGGLIAIEPQNPYFYELKGQMLVDFGRVKDSLPAYQKAIALKPEAALIRIPLAHAQIETAANNPKTLQSGVDNLKIALKDEPKSPRVHRLMATAYGRMGDEARAKLHLAEESLLLGKIEEAKAKAQNAQDQLKQGTPDWIRASDILSVANTKKP